MGQVIFDTESTVAWSERVGQYPGCVRTDFEPVTRVQARITASKDLRGRKTIHTGVCLAIKCPHCGHINAFPIGDNCRNCGKDMSNSSSTEEKPRRPVTAQATRSMTRVEAERHPNSSDEMLDLTERIAEAMERNARATELIFWLVALMVAFSLVLSVAVAIAIGWM